jgi:hypothetical protein
MSNFYCFPGRAGGLLWLANDPKRRTSNISDTLDDQAKSAAGRECHAATADAAHV